MRFSLLRSEPIMRRAFTLIELMLVLAILSIVSMLALNRVTEGLANGSSGGSTVHYTASNEQLDDLKRVIVGDERWHDGTRRDSQGNVYARSFVVDVGRLPRALTNPTNRLDGIDTDRLTLTELFSREPDVALAGAYPAASNVVGGKVSVPKDIDNDVYVTFGWDGPYLNSAAKLDDVFVRDGWNFPYETTIEKPNDARLLPYDDFAARLAKRDGAGDDGNKNAYTNGFEIGFIRHLGSDGIEEMDSARQEAIVNQPTARDQWYDLFTNAYVQTVTVIVNSTSIHAKYGVRIYGPLANPTSTVQVVKGTARVWDKTANQSVIIMTGDDLISGGQRLAIGRHVAKVWVDDGPTMKKCYLDLKAPTCVCNVTLDNEENP